MCYQASAAKQIRTELFWVITQGVVVIYYRRFGTTIGPIFKGQKSFVNFPFLDSSPLSMEPMGCPESSVRNYQYLLCNNPGERSTYALSGLPGLQYIPVFVTGN